MTQDIIIAMIITLILVYLFRDVIETFLAILLATIMLIVTGIAWFITTLANTFLQMLTGKGNAK
jgi:hypothetical protein